MDSAQIDFPALNLDLDAGYFSAIENRFLTSTWLEGLHFLKGGGWTTRSSLEIPPGELLAGAAYHHGGRAEVLVRLGDGIAHLMLTGRSLAVRAAAPSTEAANRVLTEVRDALPEVDETDAETAVHLRWWQPHMARELARMLPSIRWESVAENYVGEAAQKLVGMHGWHQPPPGGRLVLWHGDPGTGKTTAIRSLAASWRHWAEFHFITDPEEFLQNPAYLLETMADGAEDSDGGVSGKQWRIVVLEDAGEFLLPDARVSQGQALSRLLNVSDGVLGQATQTLVLITTNEPLSRLHPAVSRPGRCLVDIEFRAHNYREAEEWCRRRDLQAPAAPGSMTLAELFAHEGGRGELRPVHDFGFSGAA